jgi:hypothetical protein
MAQHISFTLDEHDRYQARIEAHCERPDVTSESPPPPSSSDDVNEPETVQASLQESLSDLHRYYRMTALKELLELHGQTLTAHLEHQSLNGEFSNGHFNELVELLRKTYLQFFKLRKQQEGHLLNEQSVEQD